YTLPSEGELDQWHIGSRITLQNGRGLQRCGRLRPRRMPDEVHRLQRRCLRVSLLLSEGRQPAADANAPGFDADGHGAEVRLTLVEAAQRVGPGLGQSNAGIHGRTLRSQAQVRRNLPVGREFNELWICKVIIRPPAGGVTSFAVGEPFGLAEL